MTTVNFLLYPSYKKKNRFMDKLWENKTKKFLWTMKSSIPIICQQLDLILIKIICWNLCQYFFTSKIFKSSIICQITNNKSFMRLEVGLCLLNNKINAFRWSVTLLTSDLHDIYNSVISINIRYFETIYNRPSLFFSSSRIIFQSNVFFIFWYHYEIEIRFILPHLPQILLREIRILPLRRFGARMKLRRILPLLRCIDEHQSLP